MTGLSTWLAFLGAMFIGYHVAGYFIVWGKK